jgi:thiamine pyrophosphate-dependent acetolactate synthase large subunit-like protein
LKSTAELEEKVEESLKINGPSLIVVPVTESPRNLGSGFWVVNDILAKNHI